MICPKCRHEKWADDICPNCGLDQKNALLEMAESARGSDRFAEASKFFDQYLQIVPNDLEAHRGNAICLYLDSLKNPNENSFRKADDAIIQVLERDWDWEKGHLSRLDLHFQFSKIESLKKEYEEISVRNAEKRATCNKILEVARLTSKFHEAPPAVRTDILDWRQELVIFFKNFWSMIFGIPFLLWMIWELAEMSRSIDENKKIYYSFVLFFLGLSVLMLFFFNVGKFGKKSNKNEKIDEHSKKS